MPNPYDDFDIAGGECSSTGEGRHVTFRADVLNHPGGVVSVGDPVVFGATADGYGVGVAFATEVNASDWIAVDTEGIWAQTVYPIDDEGNSPVRIGDVIYINRTTCVLSKISSDTTNIVFGYAMEAIASEQGVADVICVKVHWAPHRTDEYRDYLAGGAAENAVLCDVDDASTLATGYQQGYQMTFHATGAMTGDAERHNYAADMFFTNAADTPYAYNYTAYMEVTGDPTLGQVAAFSAYIPDMGDSCGNITAVDLGLAQGANSPAGRHTFIRMRNHSAGAVPDAAIMYEGTPNADYWCSWESVSLPVVAANVGGVNNTHKIRIRVAGVDYFLRLHTA